MSISREQFRDGIPWDEWKAGRRDRSEWERRFDEAQLGELRAAYQEVPTPRFVAGLLPEGDGGDTARDAVAWIAKACDQAGEDGGVELRLFPADRSPGLRQQYIGDRPGEDGAVFVVFDQDWRQIGVWGPGPRGPEEIREAVRGGEPGDAGTEFREHWRSQEPGMLVLREFLPALNGQAKYPWRAGKQMSEHAFKQVRQAREKTPESGRH